MVIDLDRCTGCHACETACYAENNIPVVGEQQVYQGRLHQWIRVERYWEGTYPNVKARFMPIPCQHCDNAPVRAGLPRLCDLPQPGGPERDGLQPVRRDALLRQQLPVLTSACSTGSSKVRDEPLNQHSTPT